MRDPGSGANEAASRVQTTKARSGASSGVRGSEVRAAAARRASEHGERQREQHLAREDRDGERGRERGEKPELGPLEVQGRPPGVRAYSSIFASSTSITGMSSWTG